MQARAPQKLFGERAGNTHFDTVEWERWREFESSLKTDVIFGGSTTVEMPYLGVRLTILVLKVYGCQFCLGPKQEKPHQLSLTPCKLVCQPGHMIHPRNW